MVTTTVIFLTPLKNCLIHCQLLEAPEYCHFKLNHTPSYLTTPLENFILLIKGCLLFSFQFPHRIIDFAPDAPTTCTLVTIHLYFSYNLPFFTTHYPVAFKWVCMLLKVTF